MMQFRFFGVLIIAVILVISNAKRLPIEDDNDLELSDLEARSFLKDKNGKDYDKSIDNLDCVLCKFNLVPCCKPNLCIKKRLQPDECLELKPRNNY